MSNNMDEAISTFCAVTGAPAHVAEHTLDAFAGDLERAINFYMENQGNSAPAAIPAPVRQISGGDDAGHPIDLTAPSPGDGLRQAAAAPASRLQPRVQEPDEEFIMDDDDDDDAMLRSMAANRESARQAARESARTMETMMNNMTRNSLLRSGLPTMFPGMAAAVPPQGPHVHPLDDDDGFDMLEDDDDLDMIDPVDMMRPRPSRAPAGAGPRGAGGRGGGLLEVRGRGVAGPQRRPVPVGGRDEVEDPDEALARRLMQEEEEAYQEMQRARQRTSDHSMHNMGTGTDEDMPGLHGLEPPPGLGAMNRVVDGGSGEGGSGRRAHFEDDDHEHLGLGMDRHELEEARMMEAAMLGIPYEPKLPPRPSTWAAPTGPVDPSVREHRDLRWEQDQAYEESLAADKAKADAAERAEREAEEAARREREAVEAAARAAQEEEDRVKRLLETKAARLQPEPAQGTAGVVSVMVRMPDGSRMSRRFNQTDPLHAVFDFVDVQHQAASIKPETYKLVNSWPRKTYQCDAPGTLADAGITSDTALFVEQA